MVNNAYHYPVNGGYDAALHLRYAKIISEEWRIPTFEETRENYNPPLFYIVSGLLVRGYSYLSGQEFFEAAKIWQFANIILAMISVYFWCQIIQSVYYQKTKYQLVYLVLLLSIPVWYKTAVMFSIEIWFLFTVSLAFWFLITHYFFKPSWRNLIILSLIMLVNLLSRLSSIALLGSLLTGLLAFSYWKKVSMLKTLLIISVVACIITIGSGWFYLGRHDEGIYGVGEGGEPETPFFKRQPLSFYIDVPFTLMMTYPVRQSTPVNKLIPIFYNEFWGDFWNYFPQRRFGLTVLQVRQDRETTTPERVSRLVLQNQVNLVSTLAMALGMFLLTWRIFANLKKPNSRWLIDVTLLAYTFLSWVGFIILLTKFPSWKGDSIKATYMISLLPIFIYFIIETCLAIKTKIYIFGPIVIWLALATMINLNFSWF